jgi:hypothetical protein
VTAKKPTAAGNKDNVALIATSPADVKELRKPLNETEDDTSTTGSAKPRRRSNKSRNKKPAVAN